MSHELKMVLGCGLSLLALFVLPAFGVSEGVVLLVFFALMFGCHLFMMRGHDHGSRDEGRRQDNGG